MTSSTSEIREDLIAVYLRQWKVLRGLLRRQTGSHELAEDALQETWIRLAGMKQCPGPIHDRQAFILRVAGNIAIDLTRRERRHGGRCISDEAILGAIEDSYPSPALALLPAKPRAALLMNRCDGLSHREIAGRLKVSESMVARYLAQALRHCRDHFRDGA